MRIEKTEDIEKFDQKKSELSSDELREKYRELNKNFKTELAPVDGGYGEKMPDRKIEALDHVMETWKKRWRKLNMKLRLRRLTMFPGIFRGKSA